MMMYERTNQKRGGQDMCIGVQELEKRGQSVWYGRWFWHPNGGMKGVECNERLTAAEAALHEGRRREVYME